MKHFNELYEKYYNAYKNDHDTNELSEAKKKKFDYKQFELLDKKMTSLITYWVLLTDYQFFEYKFCWVNN